MLLNQTKKHSKVTNCWTVDGRITSIVKTNDQQKIKMTINSSSDLTNM